MDNPSPDEGAHVRFPPPLIPVAIVLCGIALARQWPIGLAFDLAGGGRYWLGGAILAGAVLGVGLPAVVLFHREGQSEVPWTPTNAVIMRGPYRFTRNPMYLMMIILCIGFAVMLWNLWILLLTPLCAWLLYVAAIVPEETYLEAKFGESYRDFKKRVRRWI